MVSELYKDFPPGWGHVKVPTSSKKAALAGLGLYAACRRRGLWAQRLAWAATNLAGPRVLPGRRSKWTPPTDEATWQELSRRWQSEFGAFNNLAVYERPQASRLGMAILLLADDRHLAFLKLRFQSPAELSHEGRAIQLMMNTGSAVFTVPRLLGSGHVRDWHYLAYAPLPSGIHYPVLSPPLTAILARIDTDLSTLDRPLDTPGHWRPMHGDLTPWNLRRVGSALILTDWEEAGWAPPGADEVLYRAAEAAIWKKPLGVSPHHEAVRFWEKRVTARSQSDRDYRLTRLLTRALQRMEAQS